MREGDKMQDHINLIKALQDKLEAMGGQLQDEDVLTALLLSVPESYSPLVIALETQGDTLTEGQVITYLLEEEARRHENQLTAKKEGEAFIMQQSNGKTSLPSGNKINSAIDKSKHTCHYCGKKGHWASECRRKLFNKKNGKKNQAEQANDAEEVDAFFASHISKTPTTWYIDSGTSQHLSPDKNLFHGLKEIQEKKIRVGNNEIVTAKQSGNIDIHFRNTAESLTNVLYSPGITKNLMSVSELTSAGF
jgi:hypothetical protein